VKRCILVALLVPALAPVEAGGSAAGPPDFPTEMRDTAALMLRLSDLGPGYTIGDDTGCGIGVENAPDNLAQAIVTHLPESCSIQFEHRRLSPYVESGAVTFRTPDGVATLFALRREMFSYESGVQRVMEEPYAGVGEEARLFRLGDAYIPGGRDRPGAAVVWRRGLLLGTVLVAGPKEPRAVRMAQRLAVRQDRRMLAPTPLGPRDNYDLEVPFADPRIRAPIPWLGRRFAPGRGLVPLRLAYTWGPERPEPDERLPTPRARLEYEARRLRTGGVELLIWRPIQWRRISRGLGAHQLWRTPCTRARQVRLRRGHAVVYSGYARLRRGGRCPARRRDSFAAVVFFRRVVVTVNMPFCDRCADGVTGRNAPYNSVKGMTAVVRALRLYRGR
jgi:hypothetical protein